MDAILDDVAGPVRVSGVGLLKCGDYALVEIGHIGAISPSEFLDELAVANQDLVVAALKLGWLCHVIERRRPDESQPYIWQVLLNGSNEMFVTLSIIVKDR